MLGCSLSSKKDVSNTQKENPETEKQDFSEETSPKEVIDENVYYLKEEDLPEIEWFTLERVGVEHESSSDAFVFKDKFIIVSHKYPSPYIISVLDFKTKKVIAEYFKKGSGPKELFEGKVDIKDDVITILDCVQGRIARLDPELITKRKYAYEPQMTFVKNPFWLRYSVEYLNDSTIISTNSQYIEGYDVGENVPEISLVNVASGESMNEPYKLNGKCLPMNVTGGYTIKNEKGGIVILAYMRVPKLRIMDMNLKTQKVYIGPEKNDMVYGMEPNSNMLTEIDGGSCFYTSACSSKNNIFLINDRVRKSDGSVFGCNKPNPFQEIWVLDHNGNIVRRLKNRNAEDDKQMYYISYSEPTQTIYVNAWDEDDEPQLYKCVLEK